MAKLSRKKRQQQKKKQLRQQLLKSGYKSQQIAKKNITELNNDYIIIEKQRKAKEREEQLKLEERRKAKRESAKKLHTKKVDLLHEKGIDFAYYLSESVTRKIKLEDIENDKFTIENYPQIFSRFDDYTKYPFPDGISLYIAFRDYAQEHNIADIIKTQRKKSISKLEKELVHWNNKPCTYDSEKRGGSSGSAGDSKIVIGDNGTTRFTRLDALEKNLSKGTLTHEGDYKGYQEISLNEMDGVFNTSISYYEVLVLATSIMPNVNELDRKNFYTDFHTGLRHIPQIYNRLPKPTKD